MSHDITGPNECHLILPLLLRDPRRQALRLTSDTHGGQEGSGMNGAAEGLPIGHHRVPDAVGLPKVALSAPPTLSPLLSEATSTINVELNHHCLRKSQLVPRSAWRSWEI